jgi:hypothetical protein
MRTLLGTLLILAALGLPTAALADQPVVTTVHEDFSILIPGGRAPQHMQSSRS